MSARMTPHQTESLPRYRKMLEAAADADAVRQIMKEALSDPHIAHRDFHELNGLARKKLAAAEMPAPPAKKARKEEP